VPFTITLDDIVIPRRCPVLNIPLRVGSGRGGSTYQSPTLDRLVAAMGYVPGNVAVISHRANTIKSNAAVQELEAVASWLRRMLKHRH
jgi:hypothetical protein